MPARSIRRPHLGCHDARQPAPLVVRVHGLCTSLRPAPHRTGAYAVRRGDLWHHPTQAPETRCPGAHQRAAHQARHGVGLSLAARVRTRSCTIAECRRLTRTRHRTVNRSTDVAAAGPATTLAPDSPPHDIPAPASC